MMGFKETAKRFIPPLLWDALKGITPRPGGASFLGPYSSFAEAATICGEGYQSGEILRSAADQISTRNTLAPTGDLDNRSARLLAAMEYALLRLKKDELFVLDFGGALGTHYFQCRPFLPSWLKLHWKVCELPETVKVGQARLANAELEFLEYGEALGQKPDIILFSGSLQYCHAPYEILTGLNRLGATFAIFDRMPLRVTENDAAFVQKVRQKDYEASYPTWFFSKSRFLSALDQAGWKILFHWQVSEDLVLVEGKPLILSGLMAGL